MIIREDVREDLAQFLKAESEGHYKIHGIKFGFFGAGGGGSFVSAMEPAGFIVKTSGQNVTFLDQQDRHVALQIFSPKSCRRIYEDDGSATFQIGRSYGKLQLRYDET